jgi:crotonobetainyl-CoA:carnitine CoA-transferase CaiB-like acyl-CoA transferase
MTRFLTPRLMTYLGSGEIPRRTGAKDSVIAVYQSFDTADLPLTLGLGNDRIWQRFWEAVGDPDYAQDPRFSSNAERHALRPEIVSRIQELLLKKNRNEWLRLFEASGIPCGPINRIDEIAADPELARRGFFYQMEMDGTQVPQVGLGIAIDGRPASPRSAPPALGANTATVLRDLAGLDDEQINILRTKSII